MSHKTPSYTSTQHIRTFKFTFLDLATYDTVKHGVLQYTSLTDNWVTHTISG